MKIIWDISLIKIYTDNLFIHYECIMLNFVLHDCQTVSMFNGRNDTKMFIFMFKANTLVNSGVWYSTFLVSDDEDVIERDSISEDFISIFNN